MAKLSPAEQAKLEALGRAIDEMAEDIRTDKVDPTLLEKLDMTPGQFKQFVEAYKEQFDKVRAKRKGQGQTGEGTGKVGAGNGTVEAGRGTGDIATGNAGKLSPDEIRQLNERKMQKVSPDFRREVEAYFRAVSESGNTTNPPAATSQPAK